MINEKLCTLRKKKNERASKDTQHTYVEANCLLKGYEYYKY